MIQQYPVLLVVIVFGGPVLYYFAVKIIYDLIIKPWKKEKAYSFYSNVVAVCFIGISLLVLAGLNETATALLIASWLFLLPITVYAFSKIKEEEEYTNLTPAEKAYIQKQIRIQELTKNFGIINPELICPHCQTKGLVRNKYIKSDQGISGDKATAAVLTGGATVLFTGLKNETIKTQAYCEKCRSIWYF